MVRLMRHRSLKGRKRDRPNLNHRATPSALSIEDSPSSRYRVSATQFSNRLSRISLIRKCAGWIQIAVKLVCNRRRDLPAQKGMTHRDRGRLCGHASPRVQLADVANTAPVRAGSVSRA